MFSAAVQRLSKRRLHSGYPPKRNGAKDNAQYPLKKRYHVTLGHVFTLTEKILPPRIPKPYFTLAVKLADDASDSDGHKQPRAAPRNRLRSGRSQDRHPCQLRHLLRRIPLRATSNALQRDGSKYIVVQLSPTQAGAPVFPAVLAAQPANLPIKPNITRIDPNIDNSYGEQANLQLERELPDDTSISIGYIHLRGLHLIISRNINAPRFPASAGLPNLGRPDANWGNISRFESSGDSYYNGMVVAFNKRTARWASLRVSYTLSKAIDDAGNFFFSTPQNNFNIRTTGGFRITTSATALSSAAHSKRPEQEAARGLDAFCAAFSWAISSPTPRGCALTS